MTGNAADDRTQVAFWSAMQGAPDRSDAERVNNKDRTHAKRLAEIARLLALSPASRVLDIGAGNGLLERWHGPFRHYIGVDFCPEYTDEMRRACRSPSDILTASVFDIPFASLPEYDVAVMCGVNSIPGLFSSLTAQFDCLAPVYRGHRTLVTFMWSGWPEFTAATQTYSLDEVRRECGARQLRAAFHVGHLPHEFLCVIEPDATTPSGA